MKPALDSIGDQPYYVGPVGAGSVAKLVHNCAGYIIQAGLAEVFTMGVKAGVEPLDLWLAVRQGAQGRRGAFERLADHFLIDSYDPPDFALRLARKDMDLACPGREAVRRAYEVGESGAGGDDRGFESRLGRPRLAGGDGCCRRSEPGVKVNTTAEAIQDALGE